LIPTLKTHDCRAPGGETLLGASLSPTWCEWFMGAPIGWTEPVREWRRSATRASRSARKSSGTLYECWKKRENEIMMTPEKILEAVDSCKSRLFEECSRTVPAFMLELIKPERCNPAANMGGPERSMQRISHVLFCLDEIKRMATEEKSHITFEKAMRWLGFVQGYLWVCGICTIDELRLMTMPVTAPAPEPAGADLRAV
jgi:hypothetical protein